MSLATTSTVNNTSTNALPMSRTQPSPAGFTAVNGGDPASFRSNEHGRDSARPTDQPHSYMSTTEPRDSVHYHSHGWRPDEMLPSPSSHTQSDSRKRKRSSSVGARSNERGQPHQVRTDSVAQSSDLRTANLDSAIDVGSPDKAHLPPRSATSERRSRSPTEHGVPQPRERYSPVGKRNRGSPPPRPDPESAADLAERLQRYQSITRESEPDRPPRSNPDSVTYQGQQLQQYQSSIRESDNEGHAQNSTSPDPNEHTRQESYGTDPPDFDPKKKRRGFSNRTKSGCVTCRRRKKKCDEGKPTCQNCQRGGFQCGGYGPKPVGFKQNTPSRTAPAHIQSKRTYEPSHGPTGYYRDPSTEAGRPYSHWGRVVSEPEPPLPPPIDPRYSEYRPDVLHKAPTWPTNGPPPPPPSFLQDRLPPPDFASIASASVSSFNPTQPHHTMAPPLPPPPQHLDHWSTSPAPPRGLISSHPSTASTPSSARTQAQQALAYTTNDPSTLTEKQKMLLGHPYLHWLDDELQTDRIECARACEAYNAALGPTSPYSREERGASFRAVVDPSVRPHPSPTTPVGGIVGIRTVIEVPFKCDYGYNIRIGDEVVIGSGCYLQDPAGIVIGNRTILGPGVRFLGGSVCVDKSARGGSQGRMVAGAIRVGEDVFIGAGVVVLPFRTIGSGAVVGAGSVVTKDVKENTVVAGNPAKVIRRIIEPGAPHVEMHHPDIQEQNDRMIKWMRGQGGARGGFRGSVDR